MQSIGWNTNIERTNVKYIGRDIKIKDRLYGADIKIIITRGLVPGNPKIGDLGHVAAPVAKVHMDGNYIFTIPYRESDWV